MPNWTPFLRRKIAESVRRSWARDPQRRVAQSERSRNLPRSKEMREKIRTSLLGRKLSKETLRKRSLALRGRVLSVLDKKRKRLAQKKHAALPLHGECKCYVHSCQSPTNLERVLWALLSEFPWMEKEKQFGPYRVDVYLPTHHLAFEADGKRWHDDPEQKAHDLRRDSYLLKRFGLPVVRLTEEDLCG